MALERRNPLPAGTYSVDLPNKLFPIFDNWRQGNKGTVKVIKTNDDREFSWVLFSVSAPTQWADARQIGFPEIAKPTDEKSQAFEPTKDVLDQIADVLPSAASGVATLYLVGFVGVGLAAYLFRKELFNYGATRVRKLRHSRGR